MLDIKIETFLTVCQFMNFTRAAEELHITQPAVSQHIHALESRYGAKFFTYTQKTLSLTPAGELFLRAATTMRHDELRLYNRIRALDAKWKKITFGATLTIGEYIMPKPLSRLIEFYPEADICMVTSNTSELLSQLDSGLIDFAIIEGFFEKNEYDSLPFGEEKYIAVCSPDYHFSCPAPDPKIPDPGNLKPEKLKPKELKLEGLLNERLLIREPGSGTREILERHLKEKNLTIQDFSSITEIGNLNAIKSLARLGLGITFLYEPTVRREIEQGILTELSLPDFPLTHSFTFLWRKNSVFAADYKELYDLLRS